MFTLGVVCVRRVVCVLKCGIVNFWVYYYVLSASWQPPVLKPQPQSAPAWQHDRTVRRRLWINCSLQRCQVQYEHLHNVRPVNLFDDECPY